MRVLVIGHGRMGRNHARVLRSLGVDVVTVDPFARADHATLSAAPSADIAAIATPASCLAEAAADALMAGLHVLVEKPMATRVEDAQHLAALAAQRNRMLAVGFTERYNPAVLALRGLLAGRADVAHVDVVRHGLAPDGERSEPHLDLMVHDLDVLRFLGFEPTMLSSRRMERFASAHLSLNERATAALTASYLAPSKTRTLTVCADGQTMRLDYAARTVSVDDGSRARLMFGGATEPLVAEWRDVLAAAAEERAPLATAADGIAALALALEMRAPERELAAA